MGAVAVEVWTTNGGIAYDNFYLGGSEVEAKESAASYYAKKEEEEKKAAEKKAAKAAKRAAKGKGWRGLLLKAKKFGQTVLDKALDQPLAAGGTLLVLIITLLMTRKKKAVVDEDAPREIDDATATMPSGWLEDEPLLVPDPSAEAPGDWDDEEDGEWEAPVCVRRPFL